MKRLTISEVSVVTRISEKQILFMVDKGKIPFEKRGDQLFFDQEVIEKWLKESTVDTTPLC